MSGTHMHNPYFSLFVHEIVIVCAFFFSNCHSSNREDLKKMRTLLNEINRRYVHLRILQFLSFTYLRFLEVNGLRKEEKK